MHILIHIIYRVLCIVFLAPFALMMLVTTHLYALVIDIMNIPLEIDRLLSSSLENEETDTEDK
jgi:hypothetical protein